MKKIFLFLIISVMYNAQIQRVEPAFWWKGMQNPELQILLYGKDIANLSVEISDGIPIKKLDKVENRNYLFVTIDTNTVPTSSFEIRLKDGKKTKDSYRYELKTRKENSAERKSYSSKDVIYLIMPDRFANGDQKNDIDKRLTEKVDRKDPNGRHGGDLRGIIDRLDYLENLGVTALWLTPVCEDNEPKVTYHGYAQTDLYKIDGRYGTNEEYKELSTKLNDRGMMLLMDYVTNHWGISHWMIQDLPSKDWIHWFEEGEKGFVRSNYKTTTQFDQNASEIDRKYALNGWFDRSMPDMNQANPFVLKYITQNAIWWIEYAELGGFRVDTYPYNDKDSMAKWAKAITDEYPNFNIVGEAWLARTGQIAAWQKDSKLKDATGYNSNLPSVMDFVLYSEMPKAFQEKESWNTGMNRIYDTFADDFMYADTNQLLVFFENHDTERWNEMFNQDSALYKMALTLIATTRGIPQIYYGSEIGMRGEKSKGDGDIRRDFPGGWKEDEQNAFEPNSQTKMQSEFFEYTRKLLTWRKNKDVIHTGKMKHYVPQDNVYVYFRYNDTEKVMVVITSNETSKTINPKRFEESIDNKKIGVDVISGQSFDLVDDKPLKIEGKSTLILELK